MAARERHHVTTAVSNTLATHEQHGLDERHHVITAVSNTLATHEQHVLGLGERHHVITAGHHEAPRLVWSAAHKGLS